MSAVQAPRAPILAFQEKTSVVHDAGAEILAEADKLGIFEKEPDLLDEAVKLGFDVSEKLFKPSDKLEASRFPPSQDHTGRPSSASGQASKAKVPPPLQDKKLHFHRSFSVLKAEDSDSEPDIDESWS